MDNATSDGIEVKLNNFDFDYQSTTHNVFEIASLFELDDVDCGLLLIVYGETGCIFLRSNILLEQPYLSKFSTYFKLVL